MEIENRTFATYNIYPFVKGDDEELFNKLVEFQSVSDLFIVYLKYKRNGDERFKYHTTACYLSDFDNQEVTWIDEWFENMTEYEFISLMVIER